jgi:uncharacterized protein YpmB
MAKKVKVRRKKRKWGKIIGILSLVTIMIVIITLSALYQSKLQPIQKESADEYFSFSEAQALVAATNDNKSIIVSEVYFNITAVGGNASSVLVSPTQGYVSKDDYPQFEEIIQNQSKQVDVKYPYEVLSPRTDKGYAVYFYVECDEAVRARVTIYITEFEYSL